MKNALNVIKVLCLMVITQMMSINPQTHKSYIINVVPIVQSEMFKHMHKIYHKSFTNVWPVFKIVYNANAFRINSK